MLVKVADGIFIRDSVESDIEAVSNGLRKEDLQEVLAAGEESGYAAVEGSYARSCIRLTVEYRGVPVAMFGLATPTFYSSSAVVWFLGTDDMAKIPKSFVKASRKVIDWFLDKFPVIYNQVDSRYTGTIRWLKSCGAEFGKAEPYGPQGLMFEPFVIRRKR